ncbi:MAG: hypothetical protein QP753_02885 [Peptoniphilus harei]|uniref:Putative membrane protein n=1 Tax=Peptoniphilus harei ACS-146-V-Sch2b TaxID=908338 RepID=E4L155_9FIRM|nr:hypothetical protein [Peptoniphilus harei]EFR32221.1 putative membrane protein [Peptoniphilus harei ACS-146-V-Sch2b]MDK7754957.1 hypothetical protein [Peptoniphilus harei]MDK7760763.1 hypothetical protein [Peptoniphilus harei]MDK8270554.1 hypothetical protein [Peptoniphilus harei]MDK8340100.1 hypothetical protein [Peptoniphilus harei]
MKFLIYFLILIIIFCSLILIEDWYKKRRGIETDSRDVMKTYIYAFVVIEMWLSLIVFCQDKLYIYLVVFGLVAYFLYRTYTEDIMKNKYKDDPRLYKITTIIVQVVLIIYQLILFMTLEDGHKIESFGKKEFSIVLPSFILVILWLSYYLSKKSLSKIFVEKDSYRKIFMSLQILFIIIFVGFIIYNYINIDRFDFFLDRM